MAFASASVKCTARLSGIENNLMCRGCACFRWREVAIAATSAEKNKGAKFMPFRCKNLLSIVSYNKFTSTILFVNCSTLKVWPVRWPCFYQGKVPERRTWRTDLGLRTSAGGRRMAPSSKAIMVGLALAFMLVLVVSGQATNKKKEAALVSLNSSNPHSLFTAVRRC